MARTTVADAQTLTDTFSDTSVRVRVSSGPLGFLIDHSSASAATVEIQWEFSYLDDPAVGTDTDWYTPSDQAGAAANTLTGFGEGRTVVDLSNIHPGSTAGNFYPGGIPAGMNWMRVSARVSSIEVNTTTVLVLHNPGPASSTASVNAS